MFVVFLFLLGFCFGFAVRLPWALLAFVVPVALVLAATDRSIPAIVVGFAVTAIGLLVGTVVASRVDARTA
jgi:hypothetical protein